MVHWPEYICLFDIIGVPGRDNTCVRSCTQTKDANNPPSKTESRNAVDFTGPVDSVYLDAPGYVELDVGTGAPPPLCVGILGLVTCCEEHPDACC